MYAWRVFAGEAGSVALSGSLARPFRRLLGRHSWLPGLTSLLVPPFPATVPAIPGDLVSPASWSRHSRPPCPPSLAAGLTSLLGPASFLISPASSPTIPTTITQLVRNSASGSGSDLSGHDRREPNRCSSRRPWRAGQRPWRRRSASVGRGRRLPRSGPRLGRRWPGPGGDRGRGRNGGPGRCGMGVREGFHKLR
jgi:hypothetical protein